MAILNNNQILGLAVTQDQYDQVSLNRKSTFINLYDEDDEFVSSVNTLDMKQGADFLFLAEVLRAAELAGLTELNSLCSYKGLKFRISAVQTSELKSGLKRNIARREDWKKNQAPTAPVQNVPAQSQPIQQPIQQVF